jgi:hypothetical protein
MAANLAKPRLPSPWRRRIRSDRHDSPARGAGKHRENATIQSGAIQVDSQFCLG